MPALMIPLMLASTLTWLQSEYDRWETLRVEAIASNTRRNQVSDLLSIMRSAETSQRGYAISGDEALRARFVEGERATRRLLRELHGAYGGDVVQQAKLSDLDQTADAKFAEMEEVIHLRDTQGTAVALGRISDGQGQRLMSRFEQLAGQLMQREIATGAQRVQAVQARSATIQRAMWIILAIGSIVLAVMLWLLWRQRQAQYRIALASYDAAKRNQAILNGTADPILIINPSGTIEMINPAVTRTLGYEGHELDRRDISVVTDIAPGSGSFHERVGLIDGVLKVSFFHEQLVRDRSGKMIPFDIALGTMRLPDGDHLVMSLRDITERRRLDQQKNDLISSVSHELRTPLTSIIGALSLLNAEAGGELPEGARELVGIAENNGRRLIRLINDMLDIDRIEAGRFQMMMAPADLRDIALRACENFDGLARSRGAVLTCHVPDMPVTVEADDDRILQVIGNLVSNALKYTPGQGRVQITVRHGRQDGEAILQVDDEGPGIAAEFRSRIFGRFERAVEHEGTAGTGLGLAIAQEIVSLHGGKIWFEDRPTGGTRFAFSLPAKMSEIPTGGGDVEARILICESDPQLGLSLQSVLASEGYASHLVTSAMAARDAIAAHEYTMLLLDMALEDANAFEIARDLRQRAGPDSLSILVVSSQPLEEPTTRLSLDLIDWIEKPIDARRLKAAISEGVPRDMTERPTVLHLDDDQDTLDVTAMALAGEAEMFKARSLEQARLLLARRQPDLVILDYHLEHGTGLDLLPDLFTVEGVAIPAIIYSAQDLRFDDLSPVDAVLLKSRASMPDLKATIRRVIAERHARLRS
ncbi:ATP-binding protein [Sphingobium sp. B10D7B]|uniref:ATP-binding protein n=2 Tax=Sphingomonadaceae TaxID=41297 RepID=UPI0022253373|nr:ATP-binding protein [Sphingobium sp. B10D7B]